MVGKCLWRCGFYGLLLATLVPESTIAWRLQTPAVAELTHFDNTPIGGFPNEWLVKDALGRLRKGGHSNWSVAEEGGLRFLEARARGNAVTIGKEVHWDVAALPILRWSWRVIAAPPDADESVKARSDSAAGVYVFFEGGPFWNPYALKYVWSSSLQKGARTASPFSSNTRIIVLRSSADELAEWVEEERDLLADFEESFGDRQPIVKAIGLLTDSDNTSSLAVAHYRKIVAAPSSRKSE